MKTSSSGKIQLSFSWVPKNMCVDELQPSFWSLKKDRILVIVGSGIINRTKFQGRALIPSGSCVFTFFFQILYKIYFVRIFSWKTEKNFKSLKMIFLVEKRNVSKFDFACYFLMNNQWKNFGNLKEIFILEKKMR